MSRSVWEVQGILYRHWSWKGPALHFEELVLALYVLMALYLFVYLGSHTYFSKLQPTIDRTQRYCFKRIRGQNASNLHEAEGSPGTLSIPQTKSSVNQSGWMPCSTWQDAGQLFKCQLAASVAHCSESWECSHELSRSRLSNKLMNKQLKGMWANRSPWEVCRDDCVW